ncbi:MAG TPA: outer membrane protein assembly factor BamE [Sphingomicrobium sp.]|nr:outer membrane protein assembly factor BamE [Sphingomicrobium sp.]
MNGARVKFAMAIAGAALLAGCAGIRDHRGAVIDEELVSAVQVGVDNKASVEKTLGRPTFVGQFTPNDWYYVSRNTHSGAFRGPRVTKQTVLHVSFDPAGNVTGVRRTGPELVAAINPVNAKTPSLGQKTGLFEDIFGNIGTVGAGGAMPAPAP